MPPRPPILPIRGVCHQQTPRAPHTWAIYRATLPSLARTSKPAQTSLPALSTSFHSSSHVHAEVANHYETLGLTPEANGAEIKKQFYHLSKIHHPDHNPDDPNASTRFQSISNAYSVLGKPAKRQAYDRSLGLGGGPAAPPSGSYSSSQRTSSPFGARSASGLNKRRGAFRGPPPSFYASGGWGAHTTKRRAAQQGGSSTAAGSSSSGGGANKDTSGTSNGSGGTYAGGGVSGSTGGMPGDEVPHFDRQRHFERQEEIDERMATRRRARREWEEREREAMQRDLGFKVVLVTACVAGVWLIDVLFVSPWRGHKALDKKKYKR